MPDDGNMADSGDSDSTIPGLSRRKMLALSGGGVVGGLSGCLQGDSDTPANPTPEEETVIKTVVETVEGEERTVVKTEVVEETVIEEETRTVEVTREQEPVERTFDQPFGTVPTEVSFGWGGNAGSIRDYYDTHLGTMGYDGNYRFEGLTDYSLDGNELTFEIRDDLTYHNGEPVTVDSFLYHQNQLYWVDPEGSGYTQPHQKVDDTTAVYTYEEPPGSELIEISYFTFHMAYPEPKEFAINEALKDASSSEERDKILNNRVAEPHNQDTLEHKVKAGHGSTGPYKIESWDDVTDSQIRMVRHEGHPYVHDRTPEEMILHFTGGSASQDQLITQDVTDFGGGGFPGYLRGVAPRHLQTLVNFPIPRMSAVHFNYKNKDLANRNVRRAILAAEDLPSARKNAQAVRLPHTYHLGMTESLSDNFLGSDFVGNRIKYPSAPDTEKATEYMERAGYIKQNGTWVDPDGQETDITFVAKNSRSVVASGLVNPLKNFGLNVTLETRSNTTYQQTVRQEFDYDMVLWRPHGCFNIIAHPTCYYGVNKHTNLGLGGSARGSDWANATGPGDLTEGTHYVMKNGEPVSANNHKPLSPTVPKEHGSEQISGSGKEINLVALDNALRNDEKIQTNSRKGAQYFNFDLPAFDIYEHTGGAWGDTKGFDWPAQDNDKAWLMESPVKKVVRKGQVDMALE
ncbi:MAG: ABC transporter substrate-binding protein [Halobacteriales archaeon]